MRARRTRAGVARARRAWAAGGLAAVLAGYLAAVDPAEPGHYPGCPILLVTGRWCPGCGGLRAGHDLLNGRLAEAASANLLLLLALPPVAAIGLDRLLAARSDRPPRLRIGAWVLPAAVALAVLFGVVRNLPAGAWLAP